VRYLFAGVVKGIGDYGNCVGIPNIGGEVYFDAAYEGNPLVNAMAIGLMKQEELIRGEAIRASATRSWPWARAPAGTASTAPRSQRGALGGDEASRPQVQVGDPFTEKLLLEASLELIRSGHIVGIQDMGAAGWPRRSSEMAARAGTAWTSTPRVPVRERA
jgi:phosphoribosylformylglycinamidine synthase subunit PurL